MTPSPLQILIVDDEPLARERLRLLLGKEAGVTVCGEAADGRAAVDAIRKLRPDLVLLDIQMPGLDGFGVLRELEASELPMVVFVTAFDQHAVKAFEAHALDYLLKPCKPARLQDALERARRLKTLSGASGSAEADALTQRLLSLLDSRAPASAGPEPSAAGTVHLTRIPVRQGERVTFLRIAAIDWFEASGNYVVLHTGKESHIVRETLGALEEQLPPASFLRISRSVIVQLDRIRELQSLAPGEHVAILQDGRKLPMTRGLREVEEKLKFG
jgi:two-component system, LytTR family, response regulator